MKVIINEGGLTCSTINPVERPIKSNYEYPHINKKGISVIRVYSGYTRDFQKWKKAESERQTFEIANQIKYPYFDEDGFSDRYYFQPGCTYEAEIVNGKAVIK